MTKRKNKGKGVRAKKPRAAKKRAVKSVAWLRKRKALLDRKAKVRPPESQSQSESADAEGGTQASAPSILEVAMELGSEVEEDPPLRCPGCGASAESISSRMERDEFPYGVAPDTYVLTADVLAFECANCKERWTGEQAEGSRQAAVDAHLAQKKAAEDGEIFL